MSHQRAYSSEAIRVRWNSARCIHTGFCLRALPEVFDVARRPWVDLTGSDADAVAEAIERCPTGALLYERLDGDPGEKPRRPTLVLPVEDGPLMMVGDLEVKTPGGEEMTSEYRLTLCRCGLSRNQPFCDNSHLRREWRSGRTHAPKAPLPETAEDEGHTPTTVVPADDASLELTGDLRLFHSDGRPMASAGRAVLCRCGASANKPFCDGSHLRIGFRSRSPETPRDRLEAETPAAFTPNHRVPDPAEAPDPG